MRLFSAFLILSSLLIGCSEKQANDITSSSGSNNARSIKVEKNSELPKTTQKVQRVMKSFSCEIACGKFYFRKQYVTVDKQGVTIPKIDGWHQIRDQCLIDHDAVTQDTFKENISSGFWEVKTVLDTWKSHVLTYYEDNGEVENTGFKKNICSGSEYVIIERIVNGG